ncbi:MAG: NADP-dependent oxidoreductase [Steroidobacteraceae bacterium]
MKSISSGAGMLVRAAVLTAFASLAIAATPAEQKAIVQTGTGGAEVMKLQNVPVLEPAEGQVLIKVYAAAVNPVDWKGRVGNMGGGGAAAGGMAAGGEGMGAGGEGMAAGAAPGGAAGGMGGAMQMAGQAGGMGGGAAAATLKIPGSDVAGVVEKVGPGVTKFKVGDAVFAQLGQTTVNGANGAYAEYAIAGVDRTGAKPKQLTYTQAAGLGTATTTGVGRVIVAKVAKGQRVLVTGVSGGVGSAAAQAAKARGAYVIGTASAKHNAYLKKLGVDEAVDYTQGDWQDKIKNVDIVIDTVSGENATLAIKTLKKGGTLVTVGGRASADACTAAGVDCSLTGGPTDVNVVDEVAKLASDGKLNVNVDASFPLEKAFDAQEENRNGGTEGKIALIVNAAEANKK